MIKYYGIGIIIGLGKIVFRVRGFLFFKVVERKRFFFEKLFSNIFRGIYFNIIWCLIVFLI